MNKPTHRRDILFHDRMRVELELGNFDSPFTLAEALIEGTSLMIAHGVEADDVKVLLNNMSVTLRGTRPMTTLELASVERNALKEMQATTAVKKFLSPYRNETSYSSSYSPYNISPYNISITKEN